MSGKQVEKRDPLADALATMASGEFNVTDPRQVAEDIARKILGAESIEQVFGNTGGLVHSDALLGQPITVTGVRFNKSTFDESEGLPFYAVMSYADGNGEAGAASVGATNAVAQLYKLHTLDAFPIKMRLVQASKPTARGYYPQFFEPVK